MRANKKLFLISFFILVLDQVSKELIVRMLSFGQVIEIIPNFFNLTLVYNPGAAFGVFAGLPNPQRNIVLGLVLLLALFVVWHFITKEAKDDKISLYALFSILGGAVGNIIDRFRYDSVVDFLDFYIGNYHWPAFNVADSAISVGVVVLMLRMVLGTRREKDAIIN